MRARARLRVEAPCRVVDVHGEPPFALRSDRDGTVWLVGTAAGPLGGDDLELRVDVGPGARVRIRSVAAQLALPDPGRRAAHVRVVVTVADGAHLDWAPEPTIVAAGADLVQRSTVDVAAGGSLRWREVVALGRHGEEPGRLRSALRVDVGGRPLLRHDLAAGDPAVDGDEWDGPATLAGARAVGALLLAGESLEPRPGFLALDGPAILALAADAGARQVVDALAFREGTAPCTSPIPASTSPTTAR